MDNQRTPDLWTERLASATFEVRRRLQRRSPAWWRHEVAGGLTRAGRVQALIAGLVALDPTAEGRGTPPRPRADATLVDQLTVVLHDLRLAVGDGREVDVETALDAVANALRDVDPRS